MNNLAALQLANRVRSTRATLRDEVRAGRLHVCDAIDHDALQTLRVVEALRWTPHGKDGRRAAPYVARRWAAAAGASELATCGALTDRQRRVLREVVPA